MNSDSDTTIGPKERLSFVGTRLHRSTIALAVFSAVILTVTMTPYSADASISPTADVEIHTSIPLEDGLELQKITTVMSVPSDNVLPWAIVRGTIDDPAQGYPVIIQFFEQDGEEPMHVAQVDVQSDDTYEYKVRVRNVDLDTGIATNIFEGNYDIKIFKVVNSEQSNLDEV